MNNIQHLTVMLTPENAEAVHSAISGGDYASSDEIISEALGDWQLKRKSRQQKLDALRTSLALGDADREAGRVYDFDPERIIRKGVGKLAALARSE